MVSQNDHVWKEATLRVVVLGILLDKRLGFFDSSLVVFRLQSCANGFQCRFARHGFGCRSSGEKLVFVEQRRSATRYVTAYRYRPDLPCLEGEGGPRELLFDFGNLLIQAHSTIPLIPRQTISSFNKPSQSLKNRLNHPEVTCDKTAVLSAVVILKLFIYLNLLHHAQ